jgi:hypothetical protein
MSNNLLKDGVLTDGSTGLGTVTRSMVRDRAMELARIDGRAPHETSKADWEQARVQLTGQPAEDPDQSTLDETPESDRWNPVPASVGHQTPGAPNEDEDDEGRSDQERLVAEGLAGADHQQRLAAAREAEAASETSR